MKKKEEKDDWKTHRIHTQVTFCRAGGKKIIGRWALIHRQSENELGRGTKRGWEEFFPSAEIKDRERERERVTVKIVTSEREKWRQGRDLQLQLHPIEWTSHEFSIRMNSRSLLWAARVDKFFTCNSLMYKPLAKLWTDGRWKWAKEKEREENKTAFDTWPSTRLLMLLLNLLSFAVSLVVCRDFPRQDDTPWTHTRVDMDSQGLHPPLIPFVQFDLTFFLLLTLNFQLTGHCWCNGLNSPSPLQ